MSVCSAWQTHAAGVKVQAEKVWVAPGEKVMLSHLEVPAHEAPHRQGSLRTGRRGRVLGKQRGRRRARAGTRAPPAAASQRLGQWETEPRWDGAPGPCPGWHCPHLPRQGSGLLLVLQRPFLPPSLPGLVPARRQRGHGLWSVWRVSSPGRELAHAWGPVETRPRVGLTDVQAPAQRNTGH